MPLPLPDELEEDICNSFQDSGLFALSKCTRPPCSAISSGVWSRYFRFLIELTLLFLNSKESSSVVSLPVPLPLPDELEEDICNSFQDSGLFALSKCTRPPCSATSSDVWPGYFLLMLKFIMLFFNPKRSSSVVSLPVNVLM